MENPFARAAVESPSGPSSPSGHGPVLNVETPFSKGGNEGGIGFEARRADLPAPVRGYADRLHARITDIYKKYGVSSVVELHEKISSGQKPHNLKPGELKSDTEELSKLADRLKGVLDRKGFAPGEEFEAKKEDLYLDENERLLKYFGQEFEIPPLPETITFEHIKFWEKNGFKLQYWPRVRMEERKYPGRQHVLGKRNNPKGLGIEFYDELAKIRDVSENATNPNLQGLEPDELPGVWMLVDSRKKPDYITRGEQSYATEGMDDSLVRDALSRLFKEGVLPKKAWKCLRNGIGPSAFSDPRFWEAFKEAFKLDGIEGATVRLPRAIEANAMGQGPDWHGTSTCEWNEEMYRSGIRLVCGDSADGGASCLDAYDNASAGVAFRPLVVFPH